MVKHVLAVILLGSMCLAQDAVSEAKANLAAKHHKMLVEKAEHFLELKKELEEELATVNAKLEKLEKGEDVKDEMSGSIQLAMPPSTAGIAYCGTNCACWTTGR